jgi:hypothetical protein
MNLKQIRVDLLPEGAEAAPRQPPPAAPRQATLRIRTGLRAGDVYMHNPRGSNNSQEP